MSKFQELFQTRTELRSLEAETYKVARDYDVWILSLLGYIGPDPKDPRVREITTILLPQDNETRFLDNGEHLIEYLTPGQVVASPLVILPEKELDYWPLEDCLLRIFPDLDLFSFSPSRPYLRILPLDLLDPPHRTPWIRK